MSRRSKVSLLVFRSELAEKRDQVLENIKPKELVSPDTGNPAVLNSWMILWQELPGRKKKEQHFLEFDQF